MSNLPEIQITVFSDYICPFCYVGHHRLMRLKDSYDLKINWCFIEIHPETSALGEAVTELLAGSTQVGRVDKIVCAGACGVDFCHKGIAATVVSWLVGIFGREIVRKCKSRHVDVSRGI